ncbi:hypothetical protein [Paenibacillus humicus]|uniref:hypothetical protein n=1 Tax=Paenibacillus humicus TaxID=412861 RepID=UPI000FDBA787|nr:hypothetical protein [Paenibacillus humicus]
MSKQEKNMQRQKSADAAWLLGQGKRAERENQTALVPEACMMFPLPFGRRKEQPRKAAPNPDFMPIFHQGK